MYSNIVGLKIETGWAELGHTRYQLLDFPINFEERFPPELSIIDNNIWVQKKFGAGNFFGSKLNFGCEKNIGSEKNFGSEKKLCPKFLLGPKQMLGPEKNLG